MRIVTHILPLLVVASVAALVAWGARRPVELGPLPPPREVADRAAVVAAVDAYFARQWERDGIVPAEAADELLVLRRLSLALQGTIPSLEEIRRFEADTGPDRLARWAERMLADPRFADYFAERLARSFVGVEGGPFLVFRRDRFTGWLSGQLRQNRPYDEIVRALMAERGLWTGTPATNFLTAAAIEGDLDESKLAGRTVRAFLGQRMDCAQCHDHPFAEWKQSQFEGLAAFYGQARLSIVGIEDKPRDKGRPVEYVIADPAGPSARTIAPAVPFHPEWLPADGSRRRQLAAWVTHPENRRFERAIVNRVWGYLFGRPYHEPVDDLPDPGPEPDLLDLLGADFRRHGCDLRRLILVIAASRPFRLSSADPSLDAEPFRRHEAAWGVFPLTRLRPEQVIGAMLQAASVRTIDRNSHLLTRAVRFLRERDFVNEYGDLGEAELDGGPRTVPQALQQMNGRLTRELSKADFLNAAGRIANVADSDAACLEACYLVCLTRRPTPDERSALLPALHDPNGDTRRRAVEDLFWALYNAEEFSWNH